MMKLFSIELLEREIRALENKAKETTLDEQEKIILSVYRRELLVLEKVKLELFDVTGNLSEVIKRLDNRSIYCMNDSEYVDLHRKAQKFDEIQHIIASEYVSPTVAESNIENL